MGNGIAIIDPYGSTMALFKSSCFMEVSVPVCLVFIFWKCLLYIGYGLISRSVLVALCAEELRRLTEGCFLLHCVGDNGLLKRWTSRIAKRSISTRFLDSNVRLDEMVCSGVWSWSLARVCNPSFWVKGTHSQKLIRKYTVSVGKQLSLYCLVFLAASTKIIVSDTAPPHSHIPPNFCEYLAQRSRYFSFAFRDAHSRRETDATPSLSQWVRVTFCISRCRMHTMASWNTVIY